MAQTTQMNIIAYVRSDFPAKFGIPRQSGLVEELRARVVFEPEYRVAEALRGVEDFSHLWLLWEFSQAKREDWSPTVRPPRLGGNRRMGVFATRSPFRPNPIGLSCVRLIQIDWDAPDGPALVIAGADLLDGTPIYDVKPYLPYADCKPDAAGGFANTPKEPSLRVEISEEYLSAVPEDKRAALLGVLAQDPRPQYQHEAGRVYGLEFAALEVKFTVDGGVLSVRGVTERKK